MYCTGRRILSYNCFFSWIPEYRSILGLIQMYDICHPIGKHLYQIIPQYCLLTVYSTHVPCTFFPYLLRFNDIASREQPEK